MTRGSEAIASEAPWKAGERFDVRTLWAAQLARPKFATLDGGDFFVDQEPGPTAEILLAFLDRAAAGPHDFRLPHKENTR